MKNDVHLAQYRALANYTPAYGDFVVWSGLVTSWHGVVSNYNQQTNEVYIIFASIPFMLFTMDNEEQERETRKINLSKIKNATKGTWAIQQHDSIRNTVVWYV